MLHPHYERIYRSGWVLPDSPNRLTVINPATEELVGTCPAGNRTDVDRAVRSARVAFDHGPWPRMTPTGRAAILAPLSRTYGQRADVFARLITEEMGSPAAFTAQTEHPRQIIDYYTDPANLTPLAPDERDGFTVTREPVGVVAIITPWNMPHKTIMMKALPALIAGCPIIIKPAPQTPLDALALADAFDRLDLPAGILSILPTDNTAAEYLASHPGVDKIAFTGSTATGARLASIAAQATRRISLELGGKSAMLLLPGADIAAAVATVPDASLANSGQICSNQTRILVHRDDYAHTTDLLTALLASLPVGDPTDPDTTIGPLVTDAQRHQALQHISDAHSDGARLTYGGRQHHRTGYYLAPTLFTDVAPGTRLYRREVFAPVLALTPYATTEQAIEYANASDYGLDGSVWGDTAQAHRAASRLRTGTIRINGAPTGIHAPLGGFKRSGIGRELGPEGLTAFTETKVTAS